MEIGKIDAEIEALKAMRDRLTTLVRVPVKTPRIVKKKIANAGAAE